MGANQESELENKYRNAIMGWCMDLGAEKEKCTCVADYMIEEHGLPGAIAIGTDFTSVRGKEALDGFNNKCWQ
jgi:hypothetical protein